MTTNFKCSMTKKKESLYEARKSKATPNELKGIDVPKGSILEEVVDWAEYEAGEADSSIKDVIDEMLSNGGVLSGATSLIYSADGQKFFTDHKDEINKILGDYIYNINGGPFTYQGWNEEDPLALGAGNQFCLAAFAFESVAQDLLEKLM